jgi:hypothetical protein
VVTDGKDAPARSALNALDQVRYLVARWLGKTEVDTPLNARLMLATGAPPRPWFLCRDGYLASGLSPAVLRGYAALLLDANAQRMAPFAEEGILAVLGEVSADGPRITLGVPKEPTKNWAALFYLLTNEAYAVRSRVFLSNLQQDAPIDVASRNSLGKPWEDIQKEMDAYWTARSFQPAQISGAPIAPERQYRERPIETAEAQKHVADAKRGTAPDGKELAAEANPDSTNAVALFLAADDEPSTRIARDMLELASKLAPRWGDPHVEIAKLESDLARRIPRFKKALTLKPRDAELWTTLAEAQTQAQLYNDAAVSYRNAERAAANEEERTALAKRRKDYEQSKLDLVAEAKKKAEEEKARELQKLKDEAMERIRAAESKANAQAGPVSGAAPVSWKDLNGGKVPDAMAEGLLERVDCLNGQTMVTVRAGGKSLKLAADLATLVIAGVQPLRLACGVQRPPRPVAVEYFNTPDAKAATAGQAARIEYRK